MNKYTFTTKTSGTNIYASHINDLQTAVNEISTELVDGISNSTGIKFTGTSGAITLKSVSGTVTGTIFIPSTAISDTLVARNTVDTLTNKTLTSPIVSGLYLSDSSIVFEGATDNAFETTLTVVDPTADQTITLPNVTGTVVTTGDTGTITSTMISDGTIVNADISNTAAIAISKLAANAISGITLGNNLASLSAGTGLSGTAYNGSTAQTFSVDTAIVATTSNNVTLASKSIDATTGLAYNGSTSGSTTVKAAATASGTIKIGRAHV